MTLDLNKFLFNLQKSQDEAENSSSSGKKYPYRLMFVRPNDSKAKLNVRILYNTKSNAVSFPYRVHVLNDNSKLYCGKNNPNNPACELCDAIDNKYNLTKQQSKESAQGRAIMLAQYVSSIGYTFSEDYPEPKAGDIIIVQGPASLHKQIVSAMLAVGPQHLPDLLTNAVGKVVSITRDSAGKSVIVTPTYDAYKSANNDQDFEQLLKGLPSLESIAFFDGPTQEDFTRLHEMALSISRAFSPNAQAPNQLPPSMDNFVEGAQPMSQQFQKPQPTQATPAPQQTMTPTMAPTQGATPSQPTPKASGIEQYISPYCQKKNDPNNPVCQLCLAEKFCPFKEDEVPF